ncbi:TPA: VirB6/TrbL-like conjugal transfer protein, CD1112 family [Listeria monocytogenes]
MSGLFESIGEWIQELLIGIVEANLSNMFADVNEQVGMIAKEVGKTPQAWNTDIFGMIQGLSENVIVPIAGLIITYILCYELITTIMEKNNMADIDTFLFFKYFFKMCIAVFLVSHTFEITMAVFDLAQYVVNQSAETINSSANIDMIEVLKTMKERMQEMGIGELFALVFETLIVSMCMKIMAVLIMVIIYGRMIEIYLYCSVSPIPFATLSNRDWGNIGTNYFKSLFALGFQGFFIMVCVGIYAILVKAMTVSDNIHMAIFSIATYTVLLCFALFKTGSLSKSIFGAH